MSDSIVYLRMSFHDSYFMDELFANRLTKLIHRLAKKYHIPLFPRPYAIYELRKHKDFVSVVFTLPCTIASMWYAAVYVDSKQYLAECRLFEESDNCLMGELPF